MDGAAPAFLERMVAAMPDAVDRVYGHCEGYPGGAATEPHRVVAWLTARDLGTDTFFVAWPGRTVEDVRREQELRDRLEQFLDDEYRRGSLAGLRGPNAVTGLRGPNAVAGLGPDALRRRLQEVVESDESLTWARVPPREPFLVTHGRKVAALLLVPPGAVLAALAKGAVRGPSRSATRRARVALLTLAGLGGSFAWCLRRHEKADDRHDAARRPGWEAVYAEWSRRLTTIVQRENVQGQNHLASITRVKDGWFRLATLRAVLWLINLVARLIANRGSLGGIASIHFARWVLTEDRTHLLFFSNFDGSWERYLNDFIDLASGGLTAVWTNTDNDVGFPSTRWLIKEGARDEARFKAYARYSQARTRAWYSAYPDVSIDNIANNREIRRGLFEAPRDLDAWLRRF